MNACNENQREAAVDAQLRWSEDGKKACGGPACGRCSERSHDDAWHGYIMSQLLWPSDRAQNHVLHTAVH